MGKKHKQTNKEQQIEALSGNKIDTALPLLKFSQLSFAE